MIRPLIILRPDDAELAAALHARCFPDAWSAEAFARMLAAPGALALATTGPGGLTGFVLVQVAGDVADLLTIATAPDRRREGIAAALIAAVAGRLGERGVDRFTLDVAEDNAGARRLYARSGFTEDGRRRGYYTAARDVPADAILMSRKLGI